MRTDKPYSHLEGVEIPGTLHTRISVRLEKAQKAEQNMHTLRYGVYTVLSLAVCVVSAISVSSALSESGAYDFLALIFKDNSALSYSKEIILSLVESLPIVGMISLLGGLLFSGLTIPRFVRSRSVSALYAL